MKKMDQVGHDVTQLEHLMIGYASGIGRAARDVNRLGIFYDLFRSKGEHSLAEGIQKSVISQLRERGPEMRGALAEALGKLSG